MNVVLVRSKYARNIGMVSRVLANFNQQRLILVDPQCDPQDFSAFQGAAEGQKPLRNATIYRGWEEFYDTEKEAPRIAFTKRVGKKRQSTTIKQLNDLKILDGHQNLFLIFGSEDKGLSNNDLKFVHRVCHFDLPGEAQSMNLSHAVLFALKAFHDHFVDENTLDNFPNQLPITNIEDSLKLWLKTLQIDIETQKEWNALTVLRQMVLKSIPTDKELHILHSLIQQTVRKLNNASSKTNS